MHRIQIYWY